MKYICETHFQKHQIHLFDSLWKTEAIWKNIAMAVAYIGGTVLSAIAGKLGLIVASLSNGRDSIKPYLLTEKGRRIVKIPRPFCFTHV